MGTKEASQPPGQIFGKFSVRISILFLVSLDLFAKDVIEIILVSFFSGRADINSI